MVCNHIVSKSGKIKGVFCTHDNKKESETIKMTKCDICGRDIYQTEAFLCDYDIMIKSKWIDVFYGKTCDKVLCRNCGTKYGDFDFCPKHAEQYKEEQKVKKIIQIPMKRSKERIKI